MLSHWDEVQPEVIATRELSGRRVRLGDAAGALKVGLSGYTMEPHGRVMPFHVHGDEEEFFFVTSGGGVSVEGDRAYEIRAGDVVFYPASGRPHTVVAGDEGIDLLAFGSGSDTHLSWLPRAGAMWAGPHWIPLEATSPFLQEDAAGPLEVSEPSPRPPTIAKLTDLPEKERRNGDVGSLARQAGPAVGATRSGLSEIRVDPGCLSAPLHCHSVQEELFVVLEGDGKLELLGTDGRTSSSGVRRGHVICRPAGTGVAHSFRAGDDGLALLAFSRIEPADICFYPRSGKLAIRALNTVFRVERLEYWDGEG